MTIDPKNENGKREDVCPSQKGKLDLAAVRAEIRKCRGEGERPGILAQPRRACRQPCFPGSAASRISQRRIRMGRFRFAPRFLKVMGASMAMAGMTAA